MKWSGKEQMEVGSFLSLSWDRKLGVKYLLGLVPLKLTVTITDIWCQVTLNPVYRQVLVQAQGAVGQRCSLRTAVNCTRSLMICLMKLRS
jgi:hypothetical protein